MDADLQQEILVAARVVQYAHRIADAHGGRHRAIGRREGRHDRIADGLDDGAGLGRDDLG